MNNRMGEKIVAAFLAVMLMRVVFTIDFFMCLLACSRCSGAIGMFHSLLDIAQLHHLQYGTILSKL